MYSLIIIFYISLLGIITMIFLKRHEVKTGKPSPISMLGRGSDEVCQTTYGYARRFFSYFNRRSMIVIAQWLAFHLLLNIRKVYVELKHRTLLNPQGKKLIDAVRGRGEVKNHGVSFYLRRIGSK